MGGGASWYLAFLCLEMDLDECKDANNNVGQLTRPPLANAGPKAGDEPVAHLAAIVKVVDRFVGALEGEREPGLAFGARGERTRRRTHPEQNSESAVAGRVSSDSRRKAAEDGGRCSRWPDGV